MDWFEYKVNKKITGMFIVNNNDELLFWELNSNVLFTELSRMFIMSLRILETSKKLSNSLCIEFTCLFLILDLYSIQTFLKSVVHIHYKTLQFTCTTTCVSLLQCFVILKQSLYFKTLITRLNFNTNKSFLFVFILKNLRKRKTTLSNHRT